LSRTDEVVNGIKKEIDLKVHLKFSELDLMKDIGRFDEAN